jgi:hypothetical protein
MPLKIKIQKTVNVIVAFYGYEILSFMFREKHRLKVFKKRVRGKVFSCKREEVIVGYK